MRTEYFDKRQKEMFERLEKEEQEKKVRAKANDLATQKKYLEHNPALLEYLLASSIHRIFSKRKKFFTKNSKIFQRTSLNYQRKKIELLLK